MCEPKLMQIVPIQYWCLSLDFVWLFGEKFALSIDRIYYEFICTYSLNYCFHTMLAGYIWLGLHSNCITILISISVSPTLSVDWGTFLSIKLSALHSSGYTTATANQVCTQENRIQKQSTVIRIIFVRKYFTLEIFV